MTREETIARLKELGFENPVNEEGQIDLLGRGNLEGADLCEADLKGADLRGANLTRVDLKSVKYDRKTQWPDNFDPQKHLKLEMKELKDEGDV